MNKTCALFVSHPLQLLLAKPAWAAYTSEYGIFWNLLTCLAHHPMSGGCLKSIFRNYVIFRGKLNIKGANEHAHVRNFNSWGRGIV